MNLLRKKKEEGQKHGQKGLIVTVPEYVEDRQDDPEAGPSREDLAVDGLEDEMWANLGVNRRDTPAE